MMAKLEKSNFEVLGLCCSSEVPLIERILKPLNGVDEISVIVPTKTVIVLHDPLLISQTQLVEALNRERLEANVKLHGEVKFQKRWPEKWVIACGLLLALSFLKYVYEPLQWLALGAVAIGLPSVIFQKHSSHPELHSQRQHSHANCRSSLDGLMRAHMGGTLALQDFSEAGAIVFLYAISQWLESAASYKAMAVMSSLTSMAPQKAILAETGRQVDVNNVSVSTVLVVKAGDAIPIDGIIVEGQCEVDEKMLTGESFPVVKQLDDTVLAGTVNLNGYVKIKTTALAEDCVVARMTKLVEDAHRNKSTAERLIDSCAKYYIPAVMLLSAGFAVIPTAFRVRNENYWFHLALVVLVSACPCALILSTPVAIFCALSEAAMTGLLVKGGEYLEILAKVKTMAFDKTGTITRGEFVVTDFQSLCDDISLSTLLYWVSSIESKSSHPMATALVDYARFHTIEPKPENVEDFQNFPGEGIFGKIDGKDVYVGNRRISVRAGSTTVPTMEAHTMGGKTSGFIYCGPSAVGVFTLSDACRSGAKEAIEELKSLGIRTTMLTGDCHAAAVLIQDQLEDALDEVRAELLPEDKARIIEDLKKKKKGGVAMIGDGMNDAPALATADVGISMGISGSALATETGHMILMSNNIRKIPEAVRLARKTRRKLIENVIISITVKGAILALAFAGYPQVWAAVLADVGTCLVVILNSMLLLQGTQPQPQPKKEERYCNEKPGCWNMSDCHTPLISNSCCSSSSTVAEERKDKCKDLLDRQNHVSIGGDVDDATSIDDVALVEIEMAAVNDDSNGDKGAGHVTKNVPAGNSQAPTTVAPPVALTPVPTVPINHNEKPEKFNWVDFKRWQQKMLFYLTTLKPCEEVPDRGRRYEEIHCWPIFGLQDGGLKDYYGIGSRAPDYIARNICRGDDLERVIPSGCNCRKAASWLERVSELFETQEEGYVCSGTKKQAKPNKGKGPTHGPIHDPKKTIVKSKAKVKFEGKCFNCDKYGHRSADCCAPKRDRSQANVVLKMTSSKELILNNVLYVPDMRKNLVSGSLLNKHGFRMVFEVDKVVLTKVGVYLGRGYLANDMLKLNVTTLVPKAKNARIDNKVASSSAYLIESFNLWRGRLGHVNYGSIHRLINLGQQSRENVEGLWGYDEWVKLSNILVEDYAEGRRELDDVCDL
ncbi:heavy metal atpase 2 [Actinidia rufa]|uniref:Heavy metal atpase 2 n=1 Tax=Actinidia rufa TaxID=165716 RepID=A0A7J0EY91_9ERIC|nr:heavy metal atpase 2 [Actinidia rufa]